MFRKTRRLLFLLFFLACAAAPSRSQSLEINLTVSPDAPRVRVEGTRDAATKAWSFTNVYAGVMGLGERVENLKLADASGQAVAARRLAPGEYEAEREAVRFSYDLRLDPPADAGTAAHVSWLTSDRGLLLLGDLLPVPLARVRLSLTLPAGWAVATSESADAGRFVITDADKAVLVVGRELRSQKARVGDMTVSVVSTGAWAFDDQELSRAVGDILKDYEKLLGGTPRSSATVLLTPFPRPAPAQTWSAETRGGTVAVLSGQWPSKTMALGRLDTVLSHELLHLWVPNGLALEGEYDWFYEGFTLYLATRAGVRRGQLTFQDYLDAMGRAYDAYKSARGTQEVSLPDAARRRFTLSPSLVYNKGMLVAFLYDLALMRHTKGKSSLEDVYRVLFRQHGAKAARTGGDKDTQVDGNRAVIEALDFGGAMREFTRRYVEGTTPINLDAEVAAFGLRLESFGARTRLFVGDNPSREQGDLLRKLGYNGAGDPAVRRLHEKLRKP